MATELTSTTITNILEAVPGIKNVLRSPAADAMVNLTRAAAGIGQFELKDARELLRFAFRRGLINNEEHDRVLAEVEVAAQARETRLAARRAARGGPAPKAHAHHAHVAHHAHGTHHAAHGAAHTVRHHPKPAATKGHAHKAKPAPKKPVHHKAKAAKPAKKSASRPRAKGKKRRS